MKYFFLILIILGSTSSFARVKKPVKKKAVLNVASYTGPCKTAKECVSVKADACGCRSGGSNRAVLKRKLNVYEKALRHYLLDRGQYSEVCLALYKCSGEPNKVACVNRKCVLK